MFFLCFNVCFRPIDTVFLIFSYPQLSFSQPIEWQRKKMSKLISKNCSFDDVEVFCFWLSSECDTIARCKRNKLKNVVESFKLFTFDLVVKN